MPPIAEQIDVVNVNVGLVRQNRTRKEKKLREKKRDTGPTMNADTFLSAKSFLRNKPMRDIAGNPVYDELVERNLQDSNCLCYRVTWSEEFFYMASIGMIFVNISVLLLFFLWGDVIFGGKYGHQGKRSRETAGN